MTIIYSYFRLVIKVDSDSVWIDQCLDKDLAKNRCRGFLKAYVKDSFQERPVLGPEETAEKRTVNSASSLLNVWRCLIAKADATILLEKRRQESPC